MKWGLGRSWKQSSAMVSIEFHCFPEPISQLASNVPSRDCGQSPTALQSKTCYLRWRSSTMRLRVFSVCTLTMWLYCRISMLLSQVRNQNELLGGLALIAPLDQIEPPTPFLIPEIPQMSLYFYLITLHLTSQKNIEPYSGNNALSTRPKRLCTRKQQSNLIKIKICQRTSLSKSDRALQIHQKENIQHHRKYSKIYRNITGMLSSGILQACCLARLSSSMPAMHIPWTKFVWGLKHVCQSRCWLSMFVAIAESKLKHESTIHRRPGLRLCEQEESSLAVQQVHCRELCHMGIRAILIVAVNL